MPKSNSTLIRKADIFFAPVAVLAVFVALSALPVWLEQAFAYSAMVGRPDASQRAAAAAHACRADFAALLAWSALGVSVGVRWVGLWATRAQNFWLFLLRSMVEHAIVFGLCWLIEFAVLRQEPLRSMISELAVKWCDGAL